MNPYGADTRLVVRHFPTEPGYTMTLERWDAALCSWNVVQASGLHGRIDAAVAEMLGVSQPMEANNAE